MALHIALQQCSPVASQFGDEAVKLVVKHTFLELETEASPPGDFRSKRRALTTPALSFKWDGENWLDSNDLAENDTCAGTSESDTCRSASDMDDSLADVEELSQAVAELPLSEHSDSSPLRADLRQNKRPTATICLETMTGTLQCDHSDAAFSASASRSHQTPKAQCSPHAQGSVPSDFAPRAPLSAELSAAELELKAAELKVAALRAEAQAQRARADSSKIAAKQAGSSWQRAENPAWMQMVAMPASPFMPYFQAPAGWAPPGYTAAYSMAAWPTPCMPAPPSQPSSGSAPEKSSAEVPAGSKAEKDFTTLMLSNLQGLSANIGRYRNSPVMHEDVPEHLKPLLFINGHFVCFPPPTRRLRALTEQ